MHFLPNSLLVGLSVLLAFVSASGIDPFPVPFSSSFVEPVPPPLIAEFKANFMQVSKELNHSEYPIRSSSTSKSMILRGLTTLLLALYIVQHNAIVA
jgi:hypothetical protein